MEISKKESGNDLILIVSGSINTATAPLLEKELSLLPKELKSLTIDITDVDYISSSGLRDLLNFQNYIDEIGGTMIVKGCHESVREVFEMTGFDTILTIE
ncbi:MAG: STAS domain-containing protein [Bacilli bacterium]